MMKNKVKPSPPMISSLIFAIQPLSLSCKGPAAESYLLEFGRGAQTIKKYPEEIKISPQRPRHEFPAGSTDVIKLKLQSEHDLSFDWELYKAGNTVSALVDSIPVNLMQFYRIYVHSIIKSGLNSEQLTEDMRKGRLSVQQWESERQKLQWEFAQNVGKSSANDLEIAYRLQIWSEFDVWCETQANSNKSLRPEGGVPLKKEEQAEQQIQLDELPSGLQLGPRQSSEEAASPPQSPKNAPKRKHFQPISMLKRSSGLSEIIECSNECSSLLNYGERYVQLDEISRIPEEEIEQSPYISSGESFRRSNTVDSNIYSFPQPARNSRKVSTPERAFSEDGEKEDRFGKMETQPHSLVEGEEAKESKALGARMNGKLLILAIVCLIAISWLVYMTVYNVKDPKSDIKKPQRKAAKAQTSPNPAKKKKVPSKK